MEAVRRASKSSVRGQNWNVLIRHHCEVVRSRYCFATKENFQDDQGAVFFLDVLLKPTLCPVYSLARLCSPCRIRAATEETHRLPLEIQARVPAHLPLSLKKGLLSHRRAYLSIPWPINAVHARVNGLFESLRSASIP